MRILYISQYFPPEMGAPSARVSELSKHWGRLGHEVTILTAFPHHPHGVKPLRYRWLWWRRENFDGLKVVRTYVWATANKGYRRIIGYVSFAVSSIVFGAALLADPDVIVATSPQFFVGFAGYGLSRLLQCSFVLEVRDLWPRGIVEVGAMPNSWLIRFLEKMELFLYRAADKVVVVTEGMKQDIVRRGISEDKVEVIFNGTEILDRQDPNTELRRKMCFEDNFVVAYVGTHGMAHGLGVVLDAAEKLSGHSGIFFLLAGEGAEKEKLMRQAEQRKLESVRFLPQQAHEEARAIVAMADAMVVPLRNLDLFKITIPSKLFEAMGSGKPVLLGVRGEAKAIVEKYACGIAFEPENAEALARAVLALWNNPQEAREMGRRGRHAVETEFLRRNQATRYIQLLHDVIKGHQPQAC
jgi:glycosyltransferase involved in cell wall biosynthesis